MTWRNVDRGEVNSRMRDFFDVYALAEHNRMHDTWGLKAGVPAERRYRAPLKERDRGRNYASGPPSISVALFRHTWDGCSDPK